jgi:4-alpha-glucanotransferase
LKRALLEKAFAHFQAQAADAPEFTKFCAKEKTWLDDYAFFRALMEENGGSEAWDHWPIWTLML